MTRFSARPFNATAAGDVRVGNPAALAVRPGQPFQPGTAGALDEAVRAFVGLAAVGGLCGAMLDPVADAARNVDPPPPTQTGGRLDWMIPGLSVDPLGVNVLFNVLETIGQATGLAAAELTAPGRDVVPDVDADEYPRQVAAVPFALTQDLTGKHVGVEITFRGPPEGVAFDLLAADLRTWGFVAVLGGFRWAGADPLAGIAVLDDVPPPAGNVLAFELPNTTAHPAAFDSLVGVVARAARVYLPIDEVRIES